MHQLWELDLCNDLYEIRHCSNSGNFQQNMSNLRQEQWRVVKWILRYLKESSDMALCYKSTDICLHGYVESDFVGDVDSRRSNTDYVFLLGSGAIRWVSRPQKIIALFTTKAKYVAATEFCNELIWLKDFMKEFGM